MSFRLANSRWVSVLTALVAGGCFGNAESALAQRGGRPIEFSEPKSTLVVSNRQEFTPAKERPNRLEEDLSRPIQNFNRGSLDGMISLPPQHRIPTVIQSAKVRELMDKSKNWALMSPKDFTDGPTPESIFGIRELGADGKEKKKDTVLEQYFQRQRSSGNEAGAASKTDAATARREKDSSVSSVASTEDRPDDSRAESRGDPQDDSKLPTGLRRTEEDLRKGLSGSDTERSILGNSSRSLSSSALFGFGSRGSSLDPEAREKLNPKYHPLLAMPVGLGTPGGAASASLSPINPVADSSDSTGSSRSVSSVDPIPSSLRSDSPDRLAGTLSSGLAVPNLPDLNASYHRAGPLPIRPDEVYRQIKEWRRT